MTIESSLGSLSPSAMIPVKQDVQLPNVPLTSSFQSVFRALDSYMDWPAASDDSLYGSKSAMIIGGVLGITSFTLVNKIIFDFMIKLNHNQRQRNRDVSQAEYKPLRGMHTVGFIMTGLIANIFSVNVWSGATKELVQAAKLRTVFVVTLELITWASLACFVLGNSRTF